MFFESVNRERHGIRITHSSSSVFSLLSWGEFLCHLALVTLWPTRPIPPLTPALTLMPLHLTLLTLVLPPTSTLTYPRSRPVAHERMELLGQGNRFRWRRICAKRLHILFMAGETRAEKIYRNPSCREKFVCTFSTCQYFAEPINRAKR